MLSRRLLLGGAAGAALSALSGCGVTSGPAAPALTPDPSVPGHAALTRLRTALDAAAAGALTPAQADLVAWASGVNDDQHAATSLAIPSATPVPSASLSATAGPADPGPPLTGLDDALGRAAEAFTAQALDAATARPLTWASMAAWCAALRTQLPDPAAAREPARSVLQPAPQTAGEAAQAALDAASAALYGLQVAAGQRGLSTEERTRLTARLRFWTNLRDALTSAVPASASPTPAPPWFAVQSPADAADARAMAARLQASALPILGRCIAHGGEGVRAVLVRGIADVTADVPRWGGLLERWPGLPTT